MPSESARMTTAAAARFRIDEPNSLPRAVKVPTVDAATIRPQMQLTNGSGSNGHSRA